VLTAGNNGIAAEAERLANAAIGGRNSAALVMGCSAASTKDVFGGLHPDVPLTVQTIQMDDEHICRLQGCVPSNSWPEHADRSNDPAGILNATVQQLLAPDVLGQGTVSHVQLPQTGTLLIRSINKLDNSSGLTSITMSNTRRYH
jgi:hypothetical protein